MSQTAESTITLRVDTTADPSAIHSTAAAVEKLGASMNPWTTATHMAAEGNGKLREMMDAAVPSARALNDAQMRMTVTTNGVNASQDGLRRAFGSSGRAMIEFGRVAQDAQYGIAGVANNVEGLATALGIGAGLTGILATVAVGVQVATTQFDIFGTKEKEAKEEAERLAKQLEATAKASREAAETANEAAAAEDARSTALEQARQRYESLTAAIQAAIRAREAETRAAQQLDDAETELALARIADKESRGIITPAQAEEQRRTAQRAGEARKFEREQQTAADREAALQADAAVKRAAADAAAKEAEQAQRDASRLMTERERQAAKDAIKQAEQLLSNPEFQEVRNDQSIVVDRANAKLEAERDFAARNPGMRQGKLEEAQRIADFEREKLASIEARYQAAVSSRGDAETALQLDADTYGRTGFESRGQATQAAKAAEEKARQAREQAAKMEAEAEQSRASRANARRVFEMRREAADITSRSRVAGYNTDAFNEAESGREAQRQDRVQREEERLRRSAEERRRQLDNPLHPDNVRARRAGNARSEFDELKTAATAAGANEQGLKQMEQSLMAFLNGNMEALATYTRLSRLLQAALPELQSAAQEARAAAEAVRRGR